ncbi:MAG TPA: hypothetical protein VLB29_08210 [Nocardioidaceae bacterium]|nr:hypothetical protein [Nocardioidaceae bacterium]
MKVEQLLTDGLREEAQAREVDVAGLWARTQARLVEQPARRTRRLPLVAAAAACLVAVTGALGLAGLAGSDQAGPASPGPEPLPSTPVEGGVDDEFSCPEQLVHDWTRPGTVLDTDFVPSLRVGPAHQAKVHEAPRYEYEERGDRALLRFGNADGTLGSVSEFRREGDEWVRFRTDVCIGENGSIGFPERAEWDVNRHDEAPFDRVVGMPERQEGWLLVDSRRYYDDIGLVRHRALFAGLCGQRMCLRGGTPTESSGYNLRAGAVPHDASSVFLPIDEMEERKNPYGFWVIYDVEGVVESLTAEVRGQQGRNAHRFYVDGWPGQLHAVLAPFDRVESLTVVRRPGADPGAPRRTTYTPEELPGYRPALHR